MPNHTHKEALNDWMEQCRLEMRKLYLEKLKFTNSADEVLGITIILDAYKKKRVNSIDRRLALYNCR